MRIESVTAHAFGPFVDETLDLARGMTVIYGPNESGKSTWHAALYAGLCGIEVNKSRTATSQTNTGLGMVAIGRSLRSSSFRMGAG